MKTLPALAAGIELSKRDNATSLVLRSVGIAQKIEQVPGKDSAIELVMSLMQFCKFIGVSVPHPPRSKNILFSEYAPDIAIFLGLSSLCSNFDSFPTEDRIDAARTDVEAILNAVDRYLRALDKNDNILIVMNEALNV